MYIFACSLISFFLNFLYSTWSYWFSRTFLSWRRCLYFPHKFLSFFLLFLMILINLFFWLSLVLFFVVFRLSLIEITIELIPSRTTLNIILLIIIAIIKISKILITFICPKRILLFLFLAIYQIVHFRASSFSKLHIAYCQIFRFYLRNWWLIIFFIHILIWAFLCWMMWPFLWIFLIWVSIIMWW